MNLSKQIEQVDRSHLGFFGLMGLSSGLAILKIAVLASILSTRDFTLYATVFALVAFTAEIVSFGLTQSTIKKFPRLAAFGRYSEIRDDLWRLGLTIAIRHAILAVIAGTLFGLIYGQSGAIAAVSLAIFSFGMNLFSLTASLFRALDRLLALGVTSVMRTLVVLVVATIAADQTGWEGVLLAESVVSVIMGGLLVIWLIARLNQLEKVGDLASDEAVVGHRDGLILFFAYLTLAIPLAFDRSFISRFDVNDTAATYAFVGIGLTAAITVTGIFVQKFGPDTVRMMALDRHVNPQNRVRVAAVSLSSLMFLASIVGFLFLFLVFQDTYWNKYHLDLAIALTASAAIAMQINPIYDWTLLAVDGERHVLIAALVNLAIVVIGFVLCLWTASGFEGYAMSLIFGRIAQIVVADRAISSLVNRRKTEVSA